MHTFKARPSAGFPVPLVFHYNSDLSGEVIIIKGGGRNEQHLKVDPQALFDFVAEYIRRRHIARMERATTDELLSLSWSIP